MSALKLIVGLGNPGADYARTRHNVGEVWVRSVAQQYGITLASDSKFKGEIGRGIICDVDLRLLVPQTYMNLSGESVGAVQRFFKLGVDEILIAYDEMAFDPGVTKIKQGGGDNGHNGIKSVRSGLANQAQFNRLRIGVGHPNDKNLVTSYLTQKAIPQSERDMIEASTQFNDALMGDIVHGRWQEAMNALHATGDK